MKAHYFAGYSNVVKNFLPGVCGFPTIEANHSWALNPKSTFGIHPFHPDETRRDNPLADDMREAMEMIVKDSKIFLLALVTERRRLVWAGAGHHEPVTADGMMVVDVQTEEEFVPGKPRLLFESDLLYGDPSLRTTSDWDHYEVTLDGQRFVMIEEGESQPAPTQLILVQNWGEELKRLVPLN